MMFTPIVITMLAIASIIFIAGIALLLFGYIIQANEDNEDKKELSRYDLNTGSETRGGEGGSPVNWDDYK